MEFVYTRTGDQWSPIPELPSSSAEANQCTCPRGREGDNINPPLNGQMSGIALSVHSKWKLVL